MQGQVQAQLAVDRVVLSALSDAAEGWRRVVRVGRWVTMLGGLLLIAAIGPVASAAASTTPGGGRLAIAPVFGQGVLIANPGGGRLRRVCPVGQPCPPAHDPSWSPDGRELAFSSPRTYVDGEAFSATTTLMYPDGACLNCTGGISGLAPSFERVAGVLDVTSAGRFFAESVDGRLRGVLAAGGITAGVQSSSGRLAVVRSGHIWVGTSGHLTRVSAGSGPAWAPDGRRLAFTRDGKIMIEDLGHAPLRIVTSGSGPAWSPDGRSIAYIAAGHAIRIVTVATGRTRAAGTLHGRSVSWGPTPPAGPARCVAPPGSKVLAATSAAVLAQDGGGRSQIGLLGCLTAGGRERVLLTLPPEAEYDTAALRDPVIAGTMAGVILATAETHYGGQDETVEVFDLATGFKAPGRGGQSNGCADYDGYTCASQMDDLVLNAAGDSAVHVINYEDDPPSTTEAITVSDVFGIRNLDTRQTAVDNAPASLGNLSLTDDTLTWTDGAISQSAQLS